MGDKSGAKIAVVLIILAAAVFFSINPLIDGTNLGLDLQGGAQVIIQAVPEEGSTISKSDMEKLIAVMRKRVDEFGVSSPVIQSEGTDRLIIEIAGVDNPEEAIDLLGTTAKLEFKDPTGEVILTGSDLKNAKAQINQMNGQPEITLEFSDKGAEAFGSATARLVGENIGIYLDDDLIENPTVDEPIMNGAAVISGGFASFDAASNISALLRGGALPVDINILSKLTVGPTLGKDSLDKSIDASIIGLIAIALFMIAYYKLPGFMAVLSLILYGVILFWALNLIHVTLTLPGIAGFVLSVGMAVDANILIYERLNEELRAGKSLTASVNAGFKRAFTTILDSNITTLIAALVLIKFGTGAIQGFAVTLSLGLITNILVTVAFTKYILRWMSRVDLLSNKKLYLCGIRRGGNV